MTHWTMAYFLFAKGKQYLQNAVNYQHTQGAFKCNAHDIIYATTLVNTRRIALTCVHQRLPYTTCNVFNNAQRHVFQCRNKCHTGVEHFEERL